LQNGTDEDRVVDDYGRDFIARRHRFPANATGFLLAPVVWFVYFIIVYGLQGAGCAAGLDRAMVFGVGALQFLLALVTLAAVAVIAASGLWSFRAWHRLLEELEDEEHQAHGHATFLSYGALLHAGLFLVATVWSGAPILLLDPCDALGST
jgi:hypothetical protein